MQNFLEVYKDPKAIRALLESIHPIAFGQVKGKLWTTTGEIDKFTSDGAKGCGQRITKKAFAFAGEVYRIEDPDDAAHLAAQMGKPQGCFGAVLSMWKFLGAISPELALLAIVVHKSPRAGLVRDELGLPHHIYGSELIAQLKQAIETGKKHPSWGYTHGESQPIAPPKTTKSPIVAGELSGLLQVCFAEEARAKGQYDKAVAALEVAQAALDEAIENTRAIVRATEIAERLAK